MKKINKNIVGNFKAFTLVELIVVITILAILGTIAFISLQGYSRDARDSTRLTDVNSIYKQLELFVIRSGTLPIPENNIELLSSGSVIGYQGSIGQNTLNILKINNGGFDPLDKSPYIYRINGYTDAYQLMGFLENGNQLSSISSQVYATTNLINRIPLSKGKVLGIFLEQTTNIPLQEIISSGQIDIRTNTGLIDMYLTNTLKKTGKVNELFGEIEFLAESQRFDNPERKCPIGFIPVLGNIYFSQPAFCVAKYEMSYHGLTASDSTPFDGNGLWNTYSYVDNSGTRPGLGKIVSEAGNSPITEIDQSQAIAECMAMGPGYHLITNNEWMTIARDIEKQPINWSGGVVGQRFIFNGISNDTNKGCLANMSTNIPSSGDNGTVTGDSNCKGRNKLTLSNGEEIWDLSGNVGEHVNKFNTRDGTNFNTGRTIIKGSSSGNDFDDDGIYSKSYMDNYGSVFGYGTSKGMGNIFYSTGITDNIFLRGFNAWDNVNTGIFSLHLAWKYNYSFRGNGFRCAR